MKIIHMSPKDLTVWDLNLIWFDKETDFDSFSLWFDLMKERINLISFDLMKIIHTSSIALTVWDLNLIWFDKGKDFDHLFIFIWFDLVKERTLILASLMDLNFCERISKYLWLVFSLCMLSFSSAFSPRVWFYGFVVYL